MNIDISKYSLNNFLSKNEPELNLSLITAGSRNYNNEEEFNRVMDQIVDWFNGVTIISGMAKGPDRFGIMYHSKNRKTRLVKHPAKWKVIEGVDQKYIKENKYGKYNANAGMERNQKMLDEANALVAFWDGKSSGTRDIISRSIKAGILICIIKY